MAFLRLAVTAVILFFCACAVQQSEAFNWKAIPAVQEFLSSNPRARRMTAGPLDTLIDLLVQIILKLIDIIITQPFKEQIGNLTDRISFLEGSNL